MENTYCIFVIFVIFVRSGEPVEAVKLDEPGESVEWDESGSKKENRLLAEKEDKENTRDRSVPDRSDNQPWTNKWANCMATIINISPSAVSVATKVQLMLNEACDRWRHLDDILISPVDNFNVKEKL